MICANCPQLQLEVMEMRKEVDDLNAENQALNEALTANENADAQLEDEQLIIAEYESEMKKMKKKFKEKKKVLKRKLKEAK